MIDNQFLNNGIIEALGSFFDNDEFLLSGSEKEKSVYEVAISCKIGTYLYSYLMDNGFFENEYKGFSIDMEYNKMGIKKDDKTIIGIKNKCKDNTTDKIRPDIIVHKRGKSGKLNNLAVFEIKKGNLSLCDEAKLNAFTKQNSKSKFQYEYGIGLSNFKKEEKTVDISIYKNGEFTPGFVYCFNTKSFELKNKS